jgi:hypothetical protein
MYRYKWFFFIKKKIVDRVEKLVVFAGNKVSVKFAPRLAHKHRTKCG